MGEEILGLLEDGATDMLMSYLSEYLQDAMGIVVLACIPFLALAVAYCFFGIKIYRVLLVINGALSGAIVGAVLFAALFESGGAAVVGAILLGALFGALAWFIYKVFLFIETFFTGFTVTAVLLLALIQNVPAALILGVIAGIAMGVLVCIYTKLLVMIMTAYKGAGTIASILSLFFITSGAYGVLYLLLLAAFTVAGFYVQNRFFGVSYDPDKGKAGNVMLSNGKVVGIEGMYKGFEFDLEDSLTFGRDVDNCNVVFPDTCAGVSRIQCQIMFDKKTRTVNIVDRFSSYGTTLNGMKLEINRVMPLKDGDVIMFGENNVFKMNF